MEESAQAAAASVPATPKKGVFRGKRKKGAGIGEKKKTRVSWRRYQQALDDNPAIDEVIQDALAVEVPPVIDTTAAPPAQPKRTRTDDGWRTNRKVVATEKKLKRVHEKHTNKEKLTELKLTKERQNRATAEKKAMFEKEHKLQVKQELKTEKRLQLAAEKKVCI